MNDSVTFDELQNFAFAEELTPEIIRLGAKINFHILHNDECTDLYNALLELRAENEKKIQQVLINLEQNSYNLKVQRELIEDIMSGAESQSKKSLQGRDEQAKVHSLSQS